jgi:molybdenum cofactor cytidylyltransferase
MGQPKQLLPWGDRTLVRHAIHVALHSEIGPVAVVVGGHLDQVVSETKNESVQILENTSYLDGQGTSVQAGARWAIQQKFDGVLFLVCDQPHVTSDDLKKIWVCARSNPGMNVASEYENDFGVPAFFTSAFFEPLLQIKPEQGAKTVLKANLNALKVVKLGHPLFDLDTPFEYEQALKALPLEAAR